MVVVFVNACCATAPPPAGAAHDGTPEARVRTCVLLPAVNFDNVFVVLA